MLDGTTRAPRGATGSIVAGAAMAVSVALSGCGGSSPLKGGPGGGGGAGGTDGGCTADCNGALTTTDCSTYDPERFAGGVITCSAECTVDLNNCTPVVRKGALQPCTDPAECEESLLCLQQDGVRLCVARCDATTTCADNETECQIDDAGTQSGCFPKPDEPDPPDDACPLAGELRCAVDGGVVEVCSPTNRWNVVDDCTIAGGTCDDVHGPEPACIGPDDCFTAGETRCADGLTVQTCDGVLFGGELDCGPLGLVCGESAPGVYGCIGQDDCITAGATRCFGEVLQACDGTTFVLDEDCAAGGLFCEPDGAGGAACVDPTVACDHVGHVAGGAAAFFDDDVLERMWLIVDSPTGNERLIMEIWPRLTLGPLPATIDLSEHTGLETCDFCVIGLRRLDAYPDGGGPTFMPLSGTIHVDAMPESPGDLVTVTLEDVLLREVVNDDALGTTTDVPDGQLWCIDDVTASYATSRFPCVVLNTPLSEGEARCLDVLHGMTCSGAVLDSLACADRGTLCEDGAAPNSAACVPCQGSAQCAGDDVVTCSPSGVDVVDCTELDTTCFQPASGSAAQCKSCDKSGFDVYYWGPYFDDDVYRYMRVELINAAQTEVIFVENFPLFGGIAGTGTYVIQPTDTAGSPTRVYAATFTPAGDLLNVYFARAGALEITEAPTVAGDPLGFELTGIELVQVDLSWNEIPDGELWCVSQFAIAGASQRFPCSFYDQDFTETETACYGGRLIQCVDDAGGFGRVNLMDDCAANGQLCIDTSSGGTQSATCR